MMRTAILRRAPQVSSSVASRSFTSSGVMQGTWRAFGPTYRIFVSS